LQLKVYKHQWTLHTKSSHSLLDLSFGIAFLLFSIAYLHLKLCIFPYMAYNILQMIISIITKSKNNNVNHCCNRKKLKPVSLKKSDYNSNLIFSNQTFSWFTFHMCLRNQYLTEKLYFVFLLYILLEHQLFVVQVPEFFNRAAMKFLIQNPCWLIQSKHVFARKSFCYDRVCHKLPLKSTQLARLLHPITWWWTQKEYFKLEILWCRQQKKTH